LLKKYKVTDKHESLTGSVGDELLKVHKSYLPLITRLLKDIDVKAFSHITGGGIIGNTKRVVPKHLKLHINWKAWELPPIFKLIQETGKVSNDEMRKAFNIGIGLVAIVNKKDVEKTLQIAKRINENAITIGEVV